MPACLPSHGFTFRGFTPALALMSAGALLGPAGPASAASVADQWNEALIEAIRVDTPRPTVHARNLYHTSAAMYDAWAAFDPASVGVLVDVSATSDGVDADRNRAISYAAYGLLTARFAGSPGASTSLSRFDALMGSLGYDASVTTTDGDSAAALGNRIAQSYLAYGQSDGANEAGGYADTSGYAAVNAPLVVAGGAIELVDPNRWQPLTINGVTQDFLTPHWGGVDTFAAVRPEGGGGGGGAYGSDVLELPPAFGSETFKQDALEVIRFSSALDPDDPATINISPAVRGDNPLGTDDGTGHAVNPATGAAYADNVVNLADWGRVLAEFWADGPQSETPPGHWNELARAVSASPLLEKRIGGTGEAVDDLEWDVKLGLALNGAAHDAAVAAWDLKPTVDYVRPISMIRYMGRLGQSSDPDGVSYNPDGLPLEDGLVEVVTDATAAAGGRHEGLEVGSIAVRAWQGYADGTDPDDEAGGFAGVGWIPATEWLPYQAEDFVTPGFAGYVSGHSTFSRAMAEVLAAFTGDDHFPGGLGAFNFELGRGLGFEEGPGGDVLLQWATYFDAADEAGLSRLYGGIHVAADDYDGRVLGAALGQDAYARALAYFGGNATAVPSPAALPAGLVLLGGLLSRRRRS